MNTNRINRPGYWLPTFGLALLVAANLESSTRADWGSIRGNNRFHDEHRSPEERRTIEHWIAQHRAADEARAAQHIDRDLEVDRLNARFWSSVYAGTVVHALPVGRIALIVGGNPYYYYDGVFYQSTAAGFAVVVPPSGALVPTLPSGAVATTSGGTTYFYAGGAYYAQQAGGYTVVPAPLGITVASLPPGAMPVSVADNLCYLAGGAYYLPAMQGGVTVYTTVRP